MADWKYELGGVWTEIEDPLGDWNELTDDTWHAAGFEAARMLFGGTADAGGFEVSLAAGAHEGRRVGDGPRSPDRRGQWIVDVEVAGESTFVLVDDFRALLELLGQLAPMATASLLSQFAAPPAGGSYGGGIDAAIAVAVDEARRRKVGAYQYTAKE